MKELVVISGKGGTGKTSVTAALAILAGKSVVVDADVDAADLHLLLQPTEQRRATFRCGHTARIRPNDCRRCGTCREHCRFNAIVAEPDDQGGLLYRIEPIGCEGCGVCVAVCAAQAIDFPERIAGEWFVSNTRCGSLVHARLTPGGENSGRLVMRIREEARELAKAQNLELILLDGPPGIGCPVIASMSGATLALIVTEPSLSGQHDLDRVLKLTHHFKIPALVCVNKWDIHPAQTEAIEKAVLAHGARIAGRIRYTPAMTQAQLQGCTVVELPANPAADDLRQIWEVLCAYPAT